MTLCREGWCEALAVSASETYSAPGAQHCKRAVMGAEELPVWSDEAKASAGLHPDSTIGSLTSLRPWQPCCAAP
jgi:hypothetical protein